MKSDLQTGKSVNLIESPSNKEKFNNYLKSILRRRVKLVQIADIIINDMNVTRNDIVMVHVSMQNINLIDSKPEDFIYLLKMIVGTGGTLIMSAISENLYHLTDSEQINSNRNDFIPFDVIYELFRRMPDTSQSHLAEGSFAVWGKLSDSIIEDINKNESSNEKNNLFYKLCLLKAKILGIGIPLSSLPVLYSIGGKNEKVPAEEDLFSNIFSLFDIISSNSLDRISKLFNKDEISVFEKRGIPFFRIITEKACNKTLLISRNGTDI